MLTKPLVSLVQFPAYRSAKKTGIPNKLGQGGMVRFKYHRFFDEEHNTFPHNRESRVNKTCSWGLQNSRNELGNNGHLIIHKMDDDK